jgi:hypothetical protein
MKYHVGVVERLMVVWAAMFQLSPSELGLRHLRDV